jgi:hypothetical protein
MKNIHLITLLLAAATAAPSLAQRPQGPPPDPIIMAIDKNKDQKLSSREIRGAAKALLKLDKNRDKALSEDELRPESPKERRRRKSDEEENQRPPAPPASTIFSALDTDSSGDLSEEELAAAAESLAKLDQDENGKLDSEEAGLERPEQGEDERGSRPQGGNNGPPPGRGPRR